MIIISLKPTTQKTPRLSIVSTSWRKSTGHMASNMGTKCGKGFYAMTLSCDPHSRIHWTNIGVKLQTIISRASFWIQHRDCQKYPYYVILFDVTGSNGDFVPIWCQTTKGFMLSVKIISDSLWLRALTYARVFKHEGLQAVKTGTKFVPGRIGRNLGHGRECPTG